MLSINYKHKTMGQLAHLTRCLKFLKDKGFATNLNKLLMKKYANENLKHTK